MYDAHKDPYLYADTDVLKNLVGIRDNNELEALELYMVGLRFDEPIPTGKLDSHHYRKIHNHLFQDVYEWAGIYRTIRIAKGGDWFCYPDHINSQMEQLFETLKSNGYLQNLEVEEFIPRAAKFLSDLNAIHPFRDGNGRAQVTFITLLAETAGHPINIEKLNPKTFLAAMIASFKGRIAPLELELKNALA